MSERQPAHALDQVAQKWRDLAERRYAHFLELYHSGRWKHYYTEEQFLNRMREAIRLAETWSVIAPKPAPATPAEQAEPGASEAPRTAA